MSLPQKGDWINPENQSPEMSIMKAEKQLNEIINSPEFREMEWIIKIEIHPSRDDGHLKRGYGLVNEEFHTTLKHAKSIYIKLKELMQEMVLAKVTDPDATINELAVMANYQPHRASREFTPQEAEDFIAAVEDMKRENQPKIKRKSKIRKLLGF